MRNSWILLSLLVLISACSPKLTPFTQRVYDEFDWSVDDLKQVQFYLSDDIVLNRKVSQGETAISGGKIKVLDGQKVEQVVFKAGTPGLLLFSPKQKQICSKF